MKVVDHEPHSWFLFEENGMLLLDANCNHSAFGYTYMVQLSPEELVEYRKKGRSYLNNLAHDIHYSAPIVKGSKSVYIGRDVSNENSEKSLTAVRTWREKRGA